jgi:hypothetical protein
MKPTDKPAFAQLLTDALAFYRQDVSTFALGVWWQACERFELQQVAKALTAHALDPERGHFAPKPADIVRQLHGTATDRSLVAWGKVLNAVRIVGAYETVVFDDPAIHAAVTDLGGWPTVCRSDVDELPFLQRRFCDAHRAYAARPGIAYPAKLIGDSEAANRHSGQPTAAPQLIGDADAALRVLQSGSTGAPLMVTAADSLRLPRLGSEEAA